VVCLRSERLTVPPAATEPSAPMRTAGSRPNVVLFLADTLRADYLGAYGHAAPTSPRLDGFAREAVLFEDAWAQASWTRSAIASLFTGLHVGSHGVDREDRVLPSAAQTLAEVLRAGGYRTGAFVANHLLGGRFGFDQGFDAWNPGTRTLYGAATADHGEEFLEHGGTEHAKTLYQELVRVPLVVRVPRGPGGTREKATVQQIDLMPTLLALTGLPAPRALPGRDLSARLTGQRPPS